MMPRYLVPRLFAWVTGSAFCFVVVVLGLKPRAGQVGGIPVGTFLNIAMRSNIRIVVASVATNIEEVVRPETHVEGYRQVGVCFSAEDLLRRIEGWSGRVGIAGRTL
jgi:hypothetical protein